MWYRTLSSRVSIALRVDRRLLKALRVERRLLKVVVVRKAAAGSVLVHNLRAVSIYGSGRETLRRLVSYTTLASTHEQPAV